MCIHLYLTLPVPEQCEDFAVSSVRSRNPEPPGPESLRRREVACYADSRCVRVCHFSLCSCIPVCFRIPSCCGCVRSLRAPRPLAAGLATPSWLKRKKSGWRAKRHIYQVTLKYTESLTVCFTDWSSTLFHEAAKFKLLYPRGGGQGKLLLCCFKQQGEDQDVSLTSNYITSERQYDWVAHHAACVVLLFSYLAAARRRKATVCWTTLSSSLTVRTSHDHSSHVCYCSPSTSMQPNVQRLPMLSSHTLTLTNNCQEKGVDGFMMPI